MNAEAPLLCGVDLPAGGDDRFVAWFRKDIDARTIPPVIFKGRINSFRTVVTRCLRILNDDFHGYAGESVHTMFLDNSNHGSAAYEELAARGWRRHVIPINFKGTPPQDDCANNRAYMYRQFNEGLERGLRIPDKFASVGDVNHGELLAEEMAAQRIDQEARKFQLIKKKLIKEALGRSPDCSDSLALTYSERVRPLRKNARRRGRRRRRYDQATTALTQQGGWQC